MSQTLVKIEGFIGEYPLEAIKPAVVEIRNKWYFREDTDRVAEVKGRFYTVGSKLITKTPSGYILAKDAVRDYLGNFIDKTTAKTLPDGRLISGDLAVTIDGITYSKTDPAIGFDHHNKKWRKIDESVVRLSEKYYNAGSISPKAASAVDINGDVVLVSDALRLYNGLNNPPVIVHKKAGVKTVTVFTGFSKGNYENPVFKNAISPATSDGLAIIEDQVTGQNFTVLGHEYEQMRELVIKTSESFLKPKVEAIRREMNSQYSDLDEDENTAPIISLKGHRFPGNTVLGTSKNFNPVIGATFNNFAGLDYSFGVEFETSAGLLEQGDLDKTSFRAVGDGSIGSAEYVTPVLKGDDAIRVLTQDCRTLRKHTMVDDRCGLHVHIGNYNTNVQAVPITPTVDFLVPLISMACQLENDLFKITPPSRQPNYRHCHSIRNYRDIDYANWRSRVGAFVFNEEYESLKKIPDFDQYSYGENGYSKDSQLSLYAPSRYKWLNLVPLCTAAPHNTVEFRIFGGTTSEIKTINAVLISMGIVHASQKEGKKVVERYKSGNPYTLREVMRIAYGHDPVVLDSILSFIDKREAKFNSKVIRY